MARSEVFVTVSPELLSRLRACAANLDLPLEWFVAGLVCDTMESFGDGCGERPTAEARATRRQAGSPGSPASRAGSGSRVAIRGTN